MSHLRATLHDAASLTRHHSHRLALRLVRCAIQQCSELRVRLEYDWTETWRGVLGLAAFVAARHAEVRGADTAELVRAVSIYASQFSQSFKR